MNLYDGDPRLAIPQVVNSFTRHKARFELDELRKVCTEDFKIQGGQRETGLAEFCVVWNKMKDLGNILIQIRGGLDFIELTETTARTIGYGLFFGAAPGKDGAPARLDLPVFLTEFRERFVKTNDGWKLQHQHCVETMENRPPGWPWSLER
jgi:hypothetical protein